MNETNIETTQRLVKPELLGHVALITGAGRGIGKAIALELARRGASIAVCARNETNLKQTDNELQALGVRSFSAICDVRSEEAVQNFVELAERELGAVDILVNNAGIHHVESVQKQSLEQWQNVLATNLTGAMLCARATLPSMMKKGWGRVINISSISGRTGEMWASAYSSSKFGMIGLTQTLALEVARDNITVNAICPGWVATEMATEQLLSPDYLAMTNTSPEEAMSNACFSIPQNRMIEPEEVAALAAFLASENARGITGQSINICGGMSLQ